jgi:hypothetical protein
MTIKTYDIGRTLGEDLDGTNLARRRAREVESAFQDFFGIDVDLVSRMTAVPAHWFDIESDEVAINVTLSPDAQAFTWSGLWFMSIQEQLADYFGPSSGSSNITTEVVEHDLTVRQVILLLSEGDDLKKATRRAEEVREETDPSAFFLVALALFNYSLGWDAEKILDASGDFNKGNTAQGEGGIDGYWLGQAGVARHLSWEGDADGEGDSTRGLCVEPPQPRAVGGDPRRLPRDGRRPHGGARR